MNARSKRILPIVNSLKSQDVLPNQSNQKKNYTNPQSSSNNSSKPSSKKQHLNDEPSVDWPLLKKIEYANSFDLVHQYDFTELMHPVASSVSLELELEKSSSTQQHLDPPSPQLTELTTVQATEIETTSLLLSDELLFSPSLEDCTPPQAQTSPALSELLF